MSLWNKLRRIKLKDADFQNVPAQTAYTMIVLGLIHFMVLGSALIDFRILELFNWGIYNELVGDSLQIPIIIGVMSFDALIMIYGVYLLKHVAPSNQEEDDEFKKKHKIDNDDNNSL